MANRNGEWTPKIETQDHHPVNLEEMKGVVITQEAQPIECIFQTFCCYTQQNNYEVAPLPEDKSALKRLYDKNGWKPTQTELEEMTYPMIAHEKSSCCLRACTGLLGCPNYRPFRMQYFNRNGDKMGLEYRKDFSCGGMFCSPHKMEVRHNGKYVGVVEENWNIGNWCDRFWECVLCCNIPYRVKLSTGDHEYENKFDINVAFCLLGPHNNFCGSTLCRNDILFEIYPDNKDKVEYDEPVAWLQKTYGKSCGCKALSRWLCCKADNYILEWPEEATAEERALLLGATVLIDYVFFEGRNF